MALGRELGSENGRVDFGEGFGEGGGGGGGGRKGELRTGRDEMEGWRWGGEWVVKLGVRS